MQTQGMTLVGGAQVEGIREGVVDEHRTCGERGLEDKTSRTLKQSEGFQVLLRGDEDTAIL